MIDPVEGLDLLLLRVADWSCVGREGWGGVVCRCVYSVVVIAAGGLRERFW